MTTNRKNQNLNDIRSKSRDQKMVIENY